MRGSDKRLLFRRDGRLLGKMWAIGSMDMRNSRRKAEMLLDKVFCERFELEVEGSEVGMGRGVRG